jgi:hypothetical protein
MGMKLHIAADAIAKGLDPSVPHRTLGPDGMLAVPSIPEVQPQALAVVAISEPEKAPEPVTVAEEVSGSNSEAQVIESPVSEEVAKEPEPVVMASVETPKATTTKAAGKQAKGSKTVS